MILLRGESIKDGQRCFDVASSCQTAPDLALQVCRRSSVRGPGHRRRTQAVLAVCADVKQKGRKRSFVGKLSAQIYIYHISIYDVYIYIYEFCSFILMCFFNSHTLHKKSQVCSGVVGYFSLGSGAQVLVLAIFGTLARDLR